LPEEAMKEDKVFALGFGSCLFYCRDLKTVKLNISCILSQH
jgi:hypothetical protein